MILLFAFCPVRRQKRLCVTYELTSVIKSLRNSVMDGSFSSLVRYIEKTCDPSITDFN